MKVTLKVPSEFQGVITGDINKRKGTIVGNDQDGDGTVVVAHVCRFQSSPLNDLLTCRNCILMRPGQ
ncbi:unnamed protein product [Musa acuminata subsp. malaccensis]|uniref:(wild Malaysian banana) hypothetical protein n=1 Tax=Musa acuminata subsp. malaccensis TaxID=214687 RepID=A0A804JVT8_MUSAM|nr:unnamed protein product [Musa acuminata subsp. malaccensis]